MKFAVCLTALALTLYLGLHNGHLALWDSDTEKPVTVFPYLAEVYPKMDQTALNQGICVRSPAHLKQLLEDFLS